MIAGATRIAATRRVVLHLLDADANESVEVAASRGLAAETLWGMVEEMDILSFHSRPLYHWHADPDPALGRDMTEGEWSDYWDRMEREFGLELATFVEARHTKQGRPHRHRLYLLSRPDGTIAPIDHDFRRRELLGRLTELATGQPITAGRHNAWVINELRRRGEYLAADQLQAAGILNVERPSALSPEDRQADQRRAVSKVDVCTITWRAWSASDNWAAFAAALDEQGYRVGMGNKLPILIAPDGGVHRLAQAIGGGAKLAGAGPVRAKVVYDRLGDVVLPPLSELAAQPRTSAGEASDPGHATPVVTERAPAPVPTNSARRRLLEWRPRLPGRAPSSIGRVVPTQAAARRRAAPETGPLPGTRTSTASNRSAGQSLSQSEVRILQTLRSRMEAAGARVRQFRQSVAADLELSRPGRELDGRVAVLMQEVEAPSIGTADWREEWRARMASLPVEYGPRLRWVEQLEDGRTRVRMDKGIELLVADRRVTCSSGPIEEAIEPMLAHAMTRGWQPLRFFGGTPEWRAAARIAAVAAGFRVLDEAPQDPPAPPSQPYPNAAR